MGNLSLPELKDDVLQICHSTGSVQIEHVEIKAEKQGGILVEGILHVSFLYLKAEDALPFGNWQEIVPFSYLLEYTGYVTGSTLSAFKSSKRGTDLGGRSRK